MKNYSSALQDANSMAIRNRAQTPFYTLKWLGDFVLKTSYPILLYVSLCCLWELKRHSTKYQNLKWHQLRMYVNMAEEILELKRD